MGFHFKSFDGNLQSLHNNCNFFFKRIKRHDTRSVLKIFNIFNIFSTFLIPTIMQCFKVQEKSAFFFKAEFPIVKSMALNMDFKPYLYRK